MKQYVSILAVGMLAALAARPVWASEASQLGDAPGRWTTERATAWYARQPWLVGCDFGDSWSKKYTAEPPLWFHDVLNRDGTPYKPQEVDYIRKVTGK